MRWVWFSVWIGIVVFQVISVALNHFFEQQVVRGSVDVDRDLLELARRINMYWQDYSPGVDPFDTRAAGAKDRQWLGAPDPILKLSELSDAFSSKGMDTSLIVDLENWLLLESSDITPEKKEAYLKGVLQWLSPCLSGQRKPVLRKVRLEPGSESNYPDLHFEMNGDPETMGTLLLKTSGTRGDWRLRQMELLCRSSEKTWWMQGNCSYDPVILE